jgi:pimeloyl-ACP methyl ester carboxylesterase
MLPALPGTYPLGMQVAQKTVPAPSCLRSSTATPHHSNGRRAYPGPDYRTAYRTVDVNGLSVFYREAGPQGAPAVLLLHGFPSSSRMWQPLLDRLTDRFRLVAPDYPGFGHSDAPGHMEFAYTFDHLAAVVGHFAQALGLTKYTLVMQDYGGPLGFRLAIAHPERLEALIVQNAVAHEDGRSAVEDSARVLG